MPGPPNRGMLPPRWASHGRARQSGSTHTANTENSASKIDPPPRIVSRQRPQTKSITHIEHLRRTQKWSAARTAFELNNEGTDISRRTVTRHPGLMGLHRRRFIDRTATTTASRAGSFARCPGHQVHLDIKKVGRIPHGGGWHTHGRGSDHARHRRSKQDQGRTQWICVPTLCRRRILPACLRRSASGREGSHRDRIRPSRPSGVAAHGIVRTERIVTDKGACHRADAFARAMLGARHQRIKPYTPRHNGKWSATTKFSRKSYSTHVRGHQGNSEQLP